MGYGWDIYGIYIEGYIDRDGDGQEGGGRYGGQGFLTNRNTRCLLALMLPCSGSASLSGRPKAAEPLAKAGMISACTRMSDLVRCTPSAGCTKFLCLVTALAGTLARPCLGPVQALSRPWPRPRVGGGHARC